jgi:hypothetical protein
MSELNFNSGNAIVDEIGKMRFDGNIIPHAWYHTIKHTNGKPNLVAINILSDIVYFYRPTTIRDENLSSITVKKKFKEDLLQRSYDQLADYFGITKRQATDAVIFLEKLGAVKRHFRTVVQNGVKMNNVLYIELKPKGVYKLTNPNVDISTNGDTYHVVSGEGPTLESDTLPRYNGRGPTLKRETNTNTSSNTSSNISTKIYYGEFVQLSEEEHQKLVDKFGKQDTADRLAALDEYIGSTGKKYASHYHTVLSWARKETKDNRGNRNGKNKTAEELAREIDLPF